MGHKLGKNSISKLENVHEDLVRIVELAIKISKVDFGISEGFRSVETQNRYYQIGRTVDVDKPTITSIDGINKKGKHNYSPALAVDIYIYTPDSLFKSKIAYDPSHLSYVAGVIDAAAYLLKEKEEISHKVRWGGNWDSDEIITKDQSFQDMPHFELIK